MTKVLILVNRGVISSVIADNKDVKYIIINHDSAAEVPLVISGILKPKISAGKLANHFTGDDDLDSEVRETLHKLNF
jgi:hypothetical protein